MIRWKSDHVCQFNKNSFSRNFGTGFFDKTYLNVERLNQGTSEPFQWLRSCSLENLLLRVLCYIAVFWLRWTSLTFIITWLCAIFNIRKGVSSLYWYHYYVGILHFRLNDVVGTGNNTFYATNDDVWIQDLWKWKVEPFLQTPFGNIVYYDGTSAKIVADGYVLANGINLTPDQK